MCTAVTYKGMDGYFGRNLDVVRGYGERVVIAPRNILLPMRRTRPLRSHYAMIGMAAVKEGYPLFFEAVNEKGIGMAGLNFPQNAHWFGFVEGKENVAPFELIPWILGQCADLAQVRALFADTNLIDFSFDRHLPLTPLHWMISDGRESLVLESVADGLKLYENPSGVLTNNPPFPYHCSNLCNYMGLHNGALVSRFHSALPLENYSFGMGALGLPGDFSSASRFVRAFFVKENSHSGEGERSCVHQVFHILASVAMPRGCVWTEDGFEYTRYACCCNLNRCIYYYRTYDNFKIQSVRLFDADLEGKNLYEYSVTGLG